MPVWIAILALLAGGGLGLVIGRRTMADTHARREQEAEEKAAAILKNAEQQAETVKKERMLEAKDKY
ncbi:MAG: DUF3552 domain-containing protein, partial [Hymenobacter sp.]